MEAKHDAHDSLFLTTTFNLEKGEKEKKVEFPKEFSKDVELDVLGWAQGFRFATENGGDYACDFWASKVNNKGFTANADCSENAERLAVTWIVSKKDKKKAASGSFSTENAEGRKENAPEASGKVEFGEGVFEKAPTVLAALSQFDLAGGRDLKLGVDVTDISKDGFSWTISKSGTQLNANKTSANLAKVRWATNPRIFFVAQKQPLWLLATCRCDADVCNDQIVLEHKAAITADFHPCQINRSLFSTSIRHSTSSYRDGTALPQSPIPVKLG